MEYSTNKGLNAFFNTLVEREAIFIRKELLKQSKPYTNDHVLATYRFCNVHRCLDKTFVLLSRLNICNAGLRVMLRWMASNPMLDHILTVLNEPRCAQYSQWCFAWQHAEHFGEPQPLIDLILKAYRYQNIPLVSGSFIVKRYGNDAKQLHDYYDCGNAFMAKLTAGQITSTKQAVKYFKDNAPWCADFTAYCIVSDFIYTNPDSFTDLYSWTAFGPGAFRGINDIIPTTRANYLDHLRSLRIEWEQRALLLEQDLCLRVNMDLEDISQLCEQNEYADLPYMLTHPMMLDVEHWLCELHKYLRGNAKRRY